MAAETVTVSRPSPARMVAALRRGGHVAWAVVQHTWVLVLLIVIWELKSRRDPSLFVPRPSQIGTAFGELWLSGPLSQLKLSTFFFENMLPSLQRCLGGFALATAVGVLAGSLIGRVRPFRLLAQPLVRLGISTPSVMFIPLFIVLIGVNDRMIMATVAYGALWPTLVNTIDGMSSIDPRIVNSARAVGLGRWATFRLVLLPAASIRILAGLRVSMGVAVVLMVTAEMYASTRGVGHQVTLFQRRFRHPEMFAGILLAAIVGVLLNGALMLVERRVLRWKPKP